MSDNRTTELLEDLLLELMDEYAMDDFTPQTKFAKKYAKRIEQAIAATLGSERGTCECGWRGFVDGWGYEQPNYCPNCGGKMADTSERVTNDGEMLHDTGVSGYRYHIIRDGMLRMVVEGSDLKDTDVVESVEEPDTREQLESDVTAYLIDKVCTWEEQRYELRNEVSRWLDRQAAITEQECAWRWQQIAEDRDRAEMERDEMAKRIQTLEREIATLKEHRAANVEKLRMLANANAEMAWRIQQLEKEVPR